MSLVMRRRRLPVLLSLVLALGARVVYAVPLQAAAELRAVSCCTQHTGRPSSIPDARRCCQVASEADTPATMVGSADVPAAHAMPLPGDTWARPAPSPVDMPRGTIVTTRDGPPRYLTLRTIRR
jgi:hypothetical protein